VPGAAMELQKTKEAILQIVSKQEVMSIRALERHIPAEWGR